MQNSIVTCAKAVPSNIQDLTFDETRDIIRKESGSGNIHEHDIDEIRGVMEKTARGSLCASC